MGNKIVSLGPGSKPVTLAHALVEHHEQIESMVCVVVWKGGNTEVFNTHQTLMELTWCDHMMRKVVSETVNSGGT